MLQEHRDVMFPVHDRRSLHDGLATVNGSTRPTPVMPPEADLPPGLFLLQVGNNEMLRNDARTRWPTGSLPTAFRCGFSGQGQWHMFQLSFDVNPDALCTEEITSFIDYITATVEDEASA